MYREIRVESSGNRVRHTHLRVGCDWEVSFKLERERERGVLGACDGAWDEGEGGKAETRRGAIGKRANWTPSPLLVY